MPTFIANIQDFDAAYSKVIEDDFESSHDFADEFAAYESHLFSMTAADMIQKSKGQLSDNVFQFFATVFWDWMGDDGAEINESQLDGEESMINSAIPANKVKEIYETIKGEDVAAVSTQVYSEIDTEIFPSAGELQKYLSIWWAAFEKASSQERGIVVQAD